MRIAAVCLVACSSSPTPLDAATDGVPPETAPVACTQDTPTLAIATLAGCEAFGIADGPRDAARFRNPTNVVLGAGGDAFVADFDNHRVRRVRPDGTTTTIVQRDDFRAPFGLALAADGSLYVETDDNDQGIHTLDSGTIWHVEPSSGAATVVARDLGRPRGLAVLPDGRLAMSDHMHHVVSLLDPVTGIETTLAGTPDAAGYVNATGAAARFAQPYDIVVLPDGDLAVADADNHRIRRVTLAGVVTDLAGAGTAGNIDGPVQFATFDFPQGLAVAGADLYVSDVRRSLIRRIRNGGVRTVAGSGDRGWRDSDDPRDAAFYGIEGLDADGARLVIADGNIGDGNPFHRVRVVQLLALP